jgi:hypothetical protein
MLLNYFVLHGFMVKKKQHNRTKNDSLMRFIGVDNFCDDIAIMLDEERRPNKFCLICWKYISPLILLVIIFCL